MRFAPAAAALSLVLAVSTSVGMAEERKPSPRAAMLIAEGRAALAAGETQSAIDAYEAALTLDPAYSPLFLDLANAARVEGMQGKAIRYYRELLARDPGNIAAISGEGEAMVEKGALEKAKRNLAQLESMCGSSCPETQRLEARIAASNAPRMAAETNGAMPSAQN